MSSARKMSTANQYYRPHDAEPDYDLVEVEADAASKAGDVSSKDSGSEDEDGDEEGEKVSVKDMLTQGPDLARKTGDNDQPTALHIIAKEDKKSLPNLDEKMEPLIKFLCQQKNYLEIKDRSERTSLFLAIEQRKKPLVQWMCEAHPDISSIIYIVGSRGMNCLHIGVHKRIKFLDLLIDKAKPKVLAAKDGNGNTPLHLAVDYENCKREQLQYIKMMLDKGDRAIFDSTNAYPCSKKISTGESATTKSKKGKKSGNKSDPVDEAIVKGVERLLKLHYLRSRDCTDAMEILYGKNTPSDKELSFDLSGMMDPDESLTQKGLANLLRNINFEDSSIRSDHRRGTSAK
ncbi:intracellular serine protease [Fusarium agapanthi]|uniref:Intracellular serine protease n=1 Tax=Fusarium agapanthi TaxID=1803897 RepID=A0A9P5B3U6_9HYPO|nr:intracellular serine protease [Fusarium agapanthi]